MIKKFAYLFAFASAFSFCVASNQIQLPETAKVSQVATYVSSGDFQSESNTLNFSNPKNLDKNILEACDNFYYSGIIGTGGVDSINTFLQSFNKKDFSEDHQIAYVQAAKYMISAGIMASTFSNGIDQIAGEIAKWFAFGQNIGKYIQNNPTELLRAEITREKLYELSTKLNITDGDIENYIEDDSKGFDNVFVSTSFLETVHNSKESELSGAETEKTILAENAKAGKYTWAGKTVNGINFTGSAGVLIAAIKDEGERLLKTQSGGTQPADSYGYNNGNQKLPMVPNLIDRSLQDILKGDPLSEAQKNWCVCKAAIRYLYENPEATIKDAVTASINIVQGMLSDDGSYTNPLGNTIDERKSDAVLYLEMIHARDLCHVGRWQEHVGFIKTINSKMTSSSRYYFPEFQKYKAEKHEEKISSSDEVMTKTFNTKTIPVVMKNLTMYNVRGNQNNCGIYATLFQSRDDLVKWLKTKPVWEQYLPNYLLQGWEKYSTYRYSSFGMMTTGATKSMLSTTDILVSYEENYLEKDAKIQIGFLGKEEISQLGSGLDFNFVSTLHNRPMEMWLVKNSESKAVTDIASPNNLANFIQPDQNIENSSRARMIHWYLDPGHYQSLLERHDYIGFAKLMRH